MAIARPFAYNIGAPIPGTEQIGNLAVGIPTSGFASTGIAEWWNGPDEELGYVIACEVPSDTQPTPVPPITASLGFFRSDALTEPSFVEMTNNIFGQIFLTGDQCKTYLNANGYWTSWGALPGGMVLYLDSGISASYAGTGPTWYDLSGYGNNGTIQGASYVGGTAAAFSFNGSSNYVNFASVTEVPIGNDPYTISVWFNSDEMPADRGFVGWGNYGSINQVNAWRLRNSGGVSGFRHYWWGNDLDYTTPMSAGIWYNAVAAYQDGSRKLYLNNVKVAEDFPVGHAVPSASNLTIGVTNSIEWFKGKIAQVIIYKRQATEAEITAIWNSGKNRFGYGGSSGFTMTISQSGLDVVWSGSGSFNLNDLTLGSTGSIGPGFDANQAIWAIGPTGDYDSYSGASLTYPTTMGSGGVASPPLGSGDIVGVLPGGSGRVILVPPGYTSGTLLNSSATYPNTTIAGLGLSGGVYTWSWGSGSNASSLTLTIS